MTTDEAIDNMVFERETASHMLDQIEKTGATSDYLSRKLQWLDIAIHAVMTGKKGIGNGKNQN